MSRLIRKYKNREGLTLLEVGIVLAVFALIIIGVLTAVSVVNASGRNSRAATQIGNIRSAIGKFTAGGPVTIPAIGSASAMALGLPSAVPARGLMGWNQIAGYLPGSLQAAIAGKGGLAGNLTLQSANPWQGDYVLLTPLSGITASISPGMSTNSFLYGLRVTGVDAGELATVANQLRQAGTGDATVTSNATNESFTVVYSN